MKLAIINSKGSMFSRYLLKDYTSAGIDYDFALDLDDFRERGFDFKNYCGVLMHPPLGAHKIWLETVQQIFPNNRIAFATTDLGTTLQELKVTGEIPLLDFRDIKRIKSYFGIR